MTRKRSSQNFGTVAERPRKGSGSWHAFLAPSMTNGKRVRVPGVWRSEEAARKALNDYITDLRNERREVPAIAPPSTLAEAAARYIEYRSTAKRGRWAAKTEQGYRAVLDAVVKHPRANIGVLTLNRVTAPAINRWYEDLAVAGVPASRIRYARWLVSGTFKWLITRGDYVGANPVGQVAAFWSKTDTDDDSTTRLVLLPTWAELATLVTAPKFEQDRVLIGLLAWSGLRWTEATSLRCSDVWADRPMLTVARVVVWKQGKKVTSDADDSTRRLQGRWIEEPVKGGQRATVPLPTPLWEALLRLVAIRKEQADCPSPAADLVFRGARWERSPTASV
jgi:integrase